MNGKFAKETAKVKSELFTAMPEKVLQPALVMICGLPGTGKSFFSRKLAKRLPAVLIQTDRIRRTLFPKPTYSPNESYIVYSVSYSLIDEFLSDGRNVIFDATNLAERNREQVYAIADRHLARLVIVWIEAPPEVVRERMMARAEKQDPHDVSEADWQVYEKMMASVEPIRRKYIAVDSSRDIIPVVEKVLREIKRP